MRRRFAAVGGVNGVGASNARSDAPLLAESHASAAAFPQNQSIRQHVFVFAAGWMEEEELAIRSEGVLIARRGA